jgi:hypothetical protein
VEDPISRKQVTIAILQKLIDTSGEDIFSEDFLTNKAYKISETRIPSVIPFLKIVLLNAKRYGFVVDLLGNRNCVLTKSNKIVCPDPHNIYKVSGNCVRSKELNSKLSKISKLVAHYS